MRPIRAWCASVMASVRERGLAEAPARIVCDTQLLAEVIREFEPDRHGGTASERTKLERLAQGILAAMIR
jgi:hypothetical protein